MDCSDVITNIVNTLNVSGTTPAEIRNAQSAVMSLNTVNVSGTPLKGRLEECMDCSDVIINIVNTLNVNGTTPAEIRNAQSAVMSLNTVNVSSTLPKGRLEECMECSDVITNIVNTLNVNTQYTFSRNKGYQECSDIFSDEQSLQSQLLFTYNYITCTANMVQVGLRDSTCSLRQNAFMN